MSVRGVLALSAVALLAISGGIAAEGRSWPSESLRGQAPDLPPCTCRSPAGDVPLGRDFCLATPEGGRQARCVMVLNNTSWEISQNPCDSTVSLTQ